MTLEAVSLQCFGILTPNFVCAIVTCTQNISHRFDNGATCWSKVKSISIILLVVLNGFQPFGPQ